MTTLRIAHAGPRPGRLANGEFQTLGHLVVLADDTGHRAVPIWLGGDLGALYLADLWDRPGCAWRSCGSGWSAPRPGSWPPILATWTTSCGNRSCRRSWPWTG